MFFIKRKLKPLFFLFIFASSIANAIPTSNDYGALPSIQMVAISPSGESIAYRKVTESQNTIGHLRKYKNFAKMNFLSRRISIKWHSLDFSTQSIV